jgi:PhnB protein
MATLNPYLNFSGNAEEALNFYKSVFGGDFPMMMRFKDSPPEYRGASGEEEKIMHVSLPVGGSVLMASDMPEQYGKTTAGNNFSISVSTKSKEEADQIFNGLSAGGQATMPMSNTFWGSYFGMLKDKYDIQWMVSYDANPMP